LIGTLVPGRSPGILHFPPLALSSPAGIAPRDIDVLLERRVAELGEPEAMLLDEVDGEPVSPRRNRRAQREALS
jgi:hypothetical protein